MELNDGQLWKRHVDQLLKDCSQFLDKNDMEIENQEVIDIDIPVMESTAEEDPIPRHSSRIRCPPNRLNL